jgi:ectoine hydroxylase-related dioxygenase (phytanoyl-CoA dioxygenase family)
MFHAGRHTVDPYPITEEQIRFYQDNGYIQLHDVLPAAEIERLRAGMAQAVEDKKKYNANDGPRHDAGYTKVFLQMVNLWEHYPGVREYVLNPRIGEIARKLARTSRVRLWHDHALIKYPQDSKATAWHQDWVYWPMDRPGALSCWMALDDVTIKNGCMSFIPGSHKLGPLNPVDLGNTTDESMLELFPEEQRKNFRPVAMPMKAGSCTFHDGLTFHYAGPNVTDAPRRAMVTIFMPAGTRYKKLEHLVGDRANLVPGQEFDGALFPIVAGA